MNEDDPYAIKGVLVYLYTLEYPTRPTWAPSPDTNQGVSQQTNTSKSQLPGTK
jgi:hypothetical protein